MSAPDAREKVIQFFDPSPTMEAARAMAGIDVVRAFMTGAFPLPPAVLLIGAVVAHVEHGRVVMSLIPDESHINALGTMHGGVIATLFDTAFGCSVQSTIVAGRTYTTLSLGVNYVRGVTIATGIIMAEGTVEHVGRSTALVRGTLRDAEQRLLATAESTCMLFDAPPAT